MRSHTLEVKGLLVLLCLALAMLIRLATADAQVPSASDHRKQLNESKQRLEAFEHSKKGLQTDVEALAKEREEISQRLLDTAQLIQSSEAQMTVIEGRIGELERKQAALRSSLAQRHGQIAGLLGAMQRMGRNPPPVIVTRREDALSMVRSAMLLAKAFPELRDQALALTERLTELARLMDGIRSEREKLKAETVRIRDSRVQLAALMESKRQSMSERQSELARLRKEEADIAANVRELSDLIARHDRAVSAHTGLGSYESERKAAAEAPPAPKSPTAPARPDAPPASSPTVSPVPGVAEPAPAAPSPVVVAMAPPSNPKPPSVENDAAAPPGMVELAPKGTLASFSPGRLKPAIPFPKAKGLLPLPARGRHIILYGDKTQVGHSKGVYIETRYDAQVVSLSDGWVVYAGEFRSFGQLLIINAGDGYHVLLAGMSQIDVQLGQFVLAGEPVGLMGAAPRRSAVTSHETSPLLYVEIRKGDEAINPDPWWAGKPEKVQE